MFWSVIITVNKSYVYEAFKAPCKKKHRESGLTISLLYIVEQLVMKICLSLCLF